jgi:hypothetical protein
MRSRSTSLKAEVTGMDNTLAAETIRRMITGAIELQAYSRGQGQKRGPAPALAAFVGDARLLASTVDEGFSDWNVLLAALGIDPDARSGAR